MGITLANFQLKAIEALMEAMGEPNRDIILKSCTGSGKTIILTHFMDEYLKSTNKAVFVWLTPGKGNLELQSKAKMDKYIHGSNTKLLSDIMSSGFEENDACFINWEKLTKKGNNALKDSERTNFVEHIQNAIDNGLTFTIIVDESHQNDTIKADDILALFNANKIIRCSATPKNYKNALLIEIPEEDVIAEGLIKKLLIINENFEQHISVEDQISYLLDKALEKQRDLRAAYAKKDSGVNPLIIVQLPNKSDALLDRVEEYFESKGITLPTLDDLFSTQAERDDAKLERVRNIPLAELHPFKGHPFKVQNNEEMQQMIESIRKVGAITPALARPLPDGGYELISGHRRLAACQVLGVETMPVIVRELSDDEAVIAMVDANLQRETILPSEKAFAYKMKLDAIKHQGVTSAQVGQKLLSVEKVADDAGESRNQIKRYIRLTYLIPELLSMVDDGKIAFNPAVELSYLDSYQQRAVLDAMALNDCTPSHAQSIRLKKLAQEGLLDDQIVYAVLAETKPNQQEQLKFKREELRKYFPSGYTEEQMRRDIIKGLELLKRQRERNRDAR